MEAPTSTRHPAGLNDPSVLFIERLEYVASHAGPQQNSRHADLLQKITIYPDKVSFVRDDGSILSIKRHNEQARHPAKGIIMTMDHTLVNGEVALRLFGAKLPSKQDFATILKSIPGATDHSHAENIQNILSLPITGFANREGKLYSLESQTGLWSRSKAGTGIWHLDVSTVGHLPNVNWHHHEFYFSIRLLAE